MRRYALYYAPRPDEALAAFARWWLGRDPETGNACPDRVTAGLSVARLDEITADPRHYGFHGTLKAPFPLADGCTEADLLATAHSFASKRRPIQIDRIKLKAIGRFIALVPAEPSDALNRLAADCVTDSDSLRAPSPPEELARRRASGLTARQDELLLRWGYPYVLEEFRFHLTLTNSIADDAERTALYDALTGLTQPFCAGPLPVRDLVVFMQEDRSAPFRIVARFALGGGA